jgi:hypothetical protein
MLPLPPYAGRLVKRPSKGALCTVIVCMGPHAWQNAKYFQFLSDTGQIYVLCLPPYACLDKFTWPVAGCHVSLWDSDLHVPMWDGDTSYTELLRSFASCFFSYGVRGVDYTSLITRHHFYFNKDTLS